MAARTSFLMVAYSVPKIASSFLNTRTRIHLSLLLQRNNCQTANDAAVDQSKMPAGCSDADTFAVFADMCTFRARRFGWFLQQCRISKSGISTYLLVQGGHRPGENRHAGRGMCGRPVLSTSRGCGNCVAKSVTLARSFL